MEFYRQYPQLTRHIISLDGSWITKKLCHWRLEEWHKRGKIVNPIETQTELNKIMDRIKYDFNLRDLDRIVRHTRYDHTIQCIEQNYQEIIPQSIELTVFRDYNSVIKEEIDQLFNNQAIEEHNILSSINKNYNIFWLIDAGHGIWFNKLYKKQIIKYIECIVHKYNRTDEIEAGQRGGQRGSNLCNKLTTSNHMCKNKASKNGFCHLHGKPERL